MHTCTYAHISHRVVRAKLFVGLILHFVGCVSN